MRLTAKQQKFVDVYQGNGTEAAKLAGYPGNDNALAVTANRLLRNVKISTAIRARQATEAAPLIANRQDRQKFWSQIMNSTKESTKDRLRAAELLGKSEADFTDNFKHSGQIAGAATVINITIPSNGREVKKPNE